MPVTYTYFAIIGVYLYIYIYIYIFEEIMLEKLFIYCSS